MATKKAILVDKVHYFSIAEHVEEENMYSDVDISVDDYSYKFGCRVHYNQSGEDLIVMLPDSSQPITEGALIVIEFVEVDRDEDEVWEIAG